MNIIAGALWFFLPALVANRCPGIAARLGLPGNFPISERRLGGNKTWAAYYGMAGSIGTIYIQRAVGLPSDILDYARPDLWLVGLLAGFGAIVGDHAKSFFKRMVGIPPGGRWWPFDQLDFVVGSLMTTLPVIGWIGWQAVITILLATLLVHPVGNRIGYQLGLRKVPW